MNQSIIGSTLNHCNTKMKPCQVFMQLFTQFIILKIRFYTLIIAFIVTFGHIMVH